MNLEEMPDPSNFNEVTDWHTEYKKKLKEEARSEGYKRGLKRGRKDDINSRINTAILLFYVSITVSYIIEGNILQFVEVSAVYFGFVYFFKGFLKSLSVIDLE